MQSQLMIVKNVIPLDAVGVEQGELPLSLNEAPLPLLGTGEMGAFARTKPSFGDIGSLWFGS